MDAASAIPSFVDTSLKLFDRLHASYTKHKHLPQSVESLRKDLDAIKRVIGTRSGAANQEGILHSWFVNLKEIGQRIEDAVQLYNFKVTSDTDQTGWRGLFPRAHDALGGASKRLLKDIDEIKQLVAQAKERVDNYKPPTEETHPGETSAAREEQEYQHPKEANPEGLGTATTDLVRMLNGANAKLMILVIVGPSGSGKSVLAEQVYEEAQRQQQFDCVAWVTARARHEVNILLGNMLDDLEFARPPPSKNLSRHLKGLLQGKRYIIGIDGLETTGYWNDILHACPDDNMRSRIIVTTTQEEIGRSCHKNCPVYKMLPLDKYNARALLIRKVCPKTLDEEGLTTILQTCEYLPVAIANMGDHIRSVKEWDNAKCMDACDNIGLLLEEKKSGAFIGMNHVLNRSYTNLNDNAKNFLLSINTCGIYRVIKRKSLIRQWLAESMLHNQSEELANECFDALREQNFILPVKFSINGQVKAFRVNRLMRQFIEKKATSENFVTCLDIRRGQRVQPHGNIKRLFLHNHSTEDSGIGNENDFSRVRWLTYHGNASKSVMGINIDSIFLRVLVLENIENMTDDHLKAICRRSMVKYLSIRGSKNVSMLPKNIRDLHLLETLDTRNTKVDKIDMDVILLPELVHLFGEFQILFKSSSMEQFLPSIKNCKLQTLSGFFIDKSPNFVILFPDMPKLSKVRILSQHSTSEEVKEDLIVSLKRCLEGVLSQPNLHLRSLMIHFRGNCDINFMDDLEVPSPCFLQSLKLCGNLIRLPRFILSDCLKELCLSRTDIGANVLEELESLQNLEFLKLTEDPFFEAGEIFIWRTGWFMKLKRLCFDVPKLPRIDIEEEAMESLESLQLLCTELGGFSGVENLRRLEELILPSNVNGPEADNLSQQISEHTMRPKFLRPSVNADGSVRSGPILERSKRLTNEVRED